MAIAALVDLHERKPLAVIMIDGLCRSVSSKWSPIRIGVEGFRSSRKVGSKGGKSSAGYVKCTVRYDYNRHLGNRTAHLNERHTLAFPRNVRCRKTIGESFISSALARFLDSATLALDWGVVLEILAMRSNADVTFRQRGVQWVECRGRPSEYRMER